MNFKNRIVFILVVIFYSCHQPENNTNAVSVGNNSGKQDSLRQSNDKEEIRSLIRQALIWSESKSTIELLPAVANKKDSIYIGFDLDKLKSNLKKLRETNLFSEDFIENYNQIILTLDKKIKDKEFDTWNMGELPSFAFANDIDPWTLCQDFPYENPNPLNLVEVTIIKLDSIKGELYWKWGRLELNSDSSWAKFKYRFRVAKENAKWKIAYMEGFDYKESIQKD